MRYPTKRRWLLLLIWAVVFFNLFYLIFMRLEIKDRFVQKYIIDYLSKLSGGEVKIGNLNFSDSFLLVDDFSMEIPQRHITFKAKSLHFQFKLSHLLWKHVSGKSLIESVHISEPDISYSYIKKPKPKKKKKGSGLPDFEKYFKNLDIKNGRLELTVETKAYRHHEVFLNLNGKMNTNKEVLADIDAITLNNAKAFVNLNLSDRKLNYMNARVYDYVPDMMWITHIDSLNALYDIDFSYIPGDMNFDAGLKNIYLEVANRKITADSLDLFGNGKEMKLNFEAPVVDGNPVDLKGSLYNVYSSNIAVDAVMNTYDTDISDYQRYVTGYANGTAHMTGKFTDFTIDARAHADSLFFRGQKLENIETSAIVRKDNVDFIIEHAEWLGNSIESDGFYQYKGISTIHASSDTLRYQINDIKLHAKMNSVYHYKTGKTTSLSLTDFGIYTPGLTVEDLDLDLKYTKGIVTAMLSRSHDDLELNGKFDLNTGNFEFDLDLSRFKVSQTIGIFTFPNVSGNVACAGTKDFININSNLRFFDQDFGNLDGLIKTYVNIDLKNETSNIKLQTRNLTYNYEQFKVDFIASGNLDSIKTSKFVINDELKIDGAYYRNPEPAWKLKVNTEKIDVKDLLKYFIDQEEIEKYKGKIDLNADLDSRNEGSFDASILLNDLNIEGMEELNVELKLNGNKNSIAIQKGNLIANSKNIASISGELALENDTAGEIIFEFTDINLSDLLSEKSAKGSINGELRYSRESDNYKIDLDLDARKVKYHHLRIDSLSTAISQEDSLLTINKLYAVMPRNSIVEADGAIGYNLLSLDSFSSEDTLNISFHGDIINILRQNIDYIKTGNSKCHFELSCSMQENGLDIPYAKLALTGDDLRFDQQLEDIRFIELDLEMIDNIMNLRELSGKLGSGKFYIENSVGYNDEDLILHQLNLGQILISTSQTGIRFHLPGYNPKNATVSLVLKGRDSHYLRFYRNDDTPVLIGDVIITQADIVYPPGSESLSKLVNNFTVNITNSWLGGQSSEESETIETDETSDFTLPYDLDLRLQTGDNVRYVTYPFQIVFNPDSYASIQKSGDKLTFQDADLSAEEGSVELAGTILDVEDIQVNYRENLNTIELEAVFSKKVADGTEIQLLITDEGEGSFPNNLKMSLESDNAYDLTDTEKLFRLRYGRGLDEMSTEERNNLMQNDLIETAGGEIENIIIDPVINRFELFISRTLNIDYFQMETSVIYNLLSSNSDLYGSTEDYEKKYSADMLLENLSLKAGKYVLNDLLLNYNITFQKGYDSDLLTDMGVFHTISFRYDMPMDIRFLYQYNIDPWNQDSHEYKFTRTIRFDSVSDLIRKTFLRNQ